VLEGKELGERIRAGFEQMKGNENALLATRSHDTAVSANLTIFMVISGSLLSIALLLLVYRKLRKEMTRRVEAQQRAQAYSDEIEDLYNNAPCGYHSVDETDKRIIKINDTELKWLGYTREQVVGRMTQADLLAPSSAERYLRGAASAVPAQARDQRHRPQLPPRRWQRVHGPGQCHGHPQP
jgi:PAS domain-containing protein